jgi:hypothetical protein
MVTPGIDMLHQLATQINKDLGADQGTKHTTPELKKDIEELIELERPQHVHCARGPSVRHRQKTCARCYI